MVKLRWKTSVIRGWDITSAACIRAVHDETYEPRRVTKNRGGKLYSYVFLVHHGRLRWLPVPRLMAFSW